MSATVVTEGRNPHLSRNLFLTADRQRQSPRGKGESRLLKFGWRSLFSKLSLETVDKHRRTETSDFPIKEIFIPKVEEAPCNSHDFLVTRLKQRGYSTKKFEALQTAYKCEPSALQLASYSSHMISIVRRKNTALLSDHLSTGLSPNACSPYGESLIHLACRIGEVSCLRVLLESGARLQTCDDYGRTAMHDACWTAEPNFDLVDELLKRDARLFFLLDTKGYSPLSYVGEDAWKKWNNYIESRLDIFWPQRNVAVLGEEPDPVMTGMKPNSVLIPDPPGALPSHQAAILAQGKVLPSEVDLLKQNHCDDVIEDNTSFSIDKDQESEVLGDRIMLPEVVCLE